MKLLKKSILPFFIVSLLISNGLTLFNSTVYDALFAVLAHLTPSHWHSNSPARKLALKNKQIAHYKSNTKKITQRLSKRTTRNIAANLAALPAEAIPVFGTGVVLAITAMDLKDSCDDLKDMDELASALELEPNSDNTLKVCGLNVPIFDAL